MGSAIGAALDGFCASPLKPAFEPTNRGGEVTDADGVACNVVIKVHVEEVHRRAPSVDAEK